MLHQVVVKKYIDVGIKKVRFEGTYSQCLLWMVNHRWGYYEVMDANGRLKSYVLRDPKDMRAIAYHEAMHELFAGLAQKSANNSQN